MTNLILLFVLLAVLVQIKSFTLHARLQAPLQQEQQQRQSSMRIFSSGNNNGLNSLLEAQRKQLTQALSFTAKAAVALLATSQIARADEAALVSAATTPIEGAVAPFQTATTTINLNETMPAVTQVCWLDVSLGGLPAERIEISVFGTVVEKTAANFVALAKGATSGGYGYKGSDFFRVVPTFSVQGGNINLLPDDKVLMSQRGKEGRSAQPDGEPFAVENFRILHGYKDAGVVSMMKDVRTGKQDSRFFISLSPDASWADSKYTAFGLVTKGMDFVRGMSVLPTTPPSNYPNTRVKIVDSGVY